MKQIPDFTETELWTIKSTLKERYGEDVETKLADAEIRLDVTSTVLTTCPAVLWNKRSSNFVIFKLDDNRYRSQFYYRNYQQYGTGQYEYDDIASCTTTLLQVQADHERETSAKESR